MKEAEAEESEEDTTLTAALSMFPTLRQVKIKLISSAVDGICLLASSAFHSKLT